MSLRKILTVTAAVLVTFLVGVTAYHLTKRPKVDRYDKLHRLYEAAILSKSSLYNDVDGRIRCMESSESLENRFVGDNDTGECVRPSGEHFRVTLYPNDSPWVEVTRHHVEWSYQNVEFSVRYSDPKAAAAYVKAQLGY